MKINDNEFKKLQKKWYKKLKSKGFVDIEIDKNFEIMSNYLQQTNVFTDVEAKQTYYYEAEHFLNTYDFKDKLDKKVWKLHSEGQSRNEIMKKLDLSEYEARKSIEATQKEFRCHLQRKSLVPVPDED